MSTKNGLNGLGKPRLKSVDDMFQLSSSSDAFKSSITDVKITKLSAFHDHPFKLYDGERLDDMVASVVANGVMVPIIVRRKDGDVLEILAGHNRTAAAKLAGLTDIPAIIMDDVSDETALAYVVETNLMQRSFSDMSHSEKAAVIALHHSKMFAQGKRNDILEQLRMLEDGQTSSDSNSVPQQNDERLHTGKKVAEMYSLSSATVSRYLRINQLIPALKTLLDDGNIPFMAAVTLSFLDTEGQEHVAEVLQYGPLDGPPASFQRFSLNIEKANMLRLLSQEGKLTHNLIEDILSGTAIQKPVRATTVVKLNSSIYTRYFTSDQPAKEVEDIIAKALELFFSHGDDAAGAYVAT